MEVVTRDSDGFLGLAEEFGSFVKSINLNQVTEGKS